MTELLLATSERLEHARREQNNYSPREATARQIGDKALLMVVGPAAIGKTYIMRRTAEIDPNFGMVPVFTTRDKRPDDDASLFRYLPSDDESVAAILDSIEAGIPVQYAIHPETEKIYGTNQEDYPYDYNMLATLSGVVEGMRRLPFGDISTIGLVTEAPLWAYWFTQRYPGGSEERDKRRKEAISCLEWLLDQPSDSISWVKNQQDQPDVAARRIIDIANHREAPYDGRKQAELMLVAANTLGS